MNGLHFAAVIVIILLALALFLRPKEQPLRIDATPASADACAAIDYRLPGYLHPWEPIDNPDKDPRSFA